ncbi:MAG: hypothetical protein IKO72_11545 [Kiritimatiellae bacterium]|nr:hypothetical protein [Kiritimatiellia bacterium]
MKMKLHIVRNLPAFAACCAAFALFAATETTPDIDTTVSDSFWDCTGRTNTEVAYSTGGAAEGATADAFSGDTVTGGGIGTAGSPFDTCMRATDEAVLTGKFSSLPAGATFILR